METEREMGNGELSPAPKREELAFSHPGTITRSSGKGLVRLLAAKRDILLVLSELMTVMGLLASISGEDSGIEDEINLRVMEAESSEKS